MNRAEQLKEFATLNPKQAKRIRKADKRAKRWCWLQAYFIDSF